MGKTTRVLLGAVLAAVLTSGAQAAGRAGIGLEWNWQPVIPFGGFSMEASGQEATLIWDVSERFTVGVFRGKGQFSASHEYTDTTSFGYDSDLKLSVKAPTSVSGIRLLTNLPVLNDKIAVGIEMGALAVGNSNEHYSSSTGDTPLDWPASFGGPDTSVYDGVVAPLMGLMGKIKLIEASTSTVTTAVTVSAALRFIPLEDSDLLGTQEVNTTEVPPAGIDPITNYTNLAVSVGVGLWF